jgi:osmotically-inducible protein OsmY
MVLTLESAPAAERRLDEDIQADVWDALWRNDQIRVLERDSMIVEVADGVVTLRGHVASSLNAEAAEELAADVPGVTGIQNLLVADFDLEMAISAALAAEPLTMACLLRVGAFHGWISLAGEVPSPEAQAAAQACAVAVPGVRGVLGLPRIAGSPPSPVRRALQPHVGAAVYALDGRAGRISFVAIDPSDRLVASLCVRARFDLDSRTVAGDRLVPIEAVRVVSEGGVFLTDTLQQVAERPAPPEGGLPRSPEEWEPPFHYSRDHVRWPAAERP